MANTSPQSSVVRQWARSKGMEVGERGRLSPEVLAAYAAAHGGAPVKAAAKAAPAKKKAAKKAASKTSATKKTAKRAPVKKAPAGSASATPTRVSNPPRESAPVESPRPSFVAAPPVAAEDDGRVAALEAQIAKLSARLEGLEAARPAGAKRGLFSRKK